MVKALIVKSILIVVSIPLLFINGCGSKRNDNSVQSAPKGIDDIKKIQKTEIIIDRNNYEYQWDDFPKHKYADTTGSATLVLSKDGDLYYFGKESANPVVIMRDVKHFSMCDDSDTMGYTAPVAVMLTNDGDLYACGNTTYDTIRDVSVLNQIPENTEISFLEPLLINTNVKECSVSFREIDYITYDNKLFRSTYNYWLFDMDIDNPTEAEEVENITGYFHEKQNYNFVLSHTVQMGCGRSFFISVLEDGSVWSCFLPANEEDVQYAIGYGEIMGDGTDKLIEATPTRIFPPGTCF